MTHPDVGGVRYNVGARTSLSTREVLARLSEIAREAGKTLWLDLKGRQLRIAKWADPTYGDIELDREIVVEGPACIHFRGGGSTRVVEVRGRG
ncbi:MAG: hypothetical protein HY815_11475 [Candidatus Riflebacteria bacterium]|nr:hypothetical protein [Candidatus Riflebacteria bacterium]